MQASHTQLSPASRYYVRRLIKQSANLIQQTYQPQALIPDDPHSPIDVEHALDHLLQSAPDAAVKVAELERLVHLHQGLSSQGNHFHNDVVELEAQVFALLGLFPQNALDLESDFTVPDLKAPTLLAANSGHVAAARSRESTSTKKAQFYIDQLNQLSQFAQKYLGPHLVINFWQSTRPAVPWLADLELSRKAEFQWAAAAEVVLTAEQVQEVQEWVEQFTRQCSGVIASFAQMLPKLDLSVPLQPSSSSDSLQPSSQPSDPGTCPKKPEPLPSSLTEELRQGIANQELQAYYQPIVDLSNLQVVGFEALVRWQHPERGLVMPEAFITTAEASGLIVDLDRWMLNHACEQLVAWQTRFPTFSSLSISVNVSPQQLAQASLVEQVSRVLELTGLPAHCLKLEITEGAIAGDSVQIATTLRQLRQMQVQLDLDDFGTGYSSLSRLQDFPFNALKIDRAFVHRLGTTPESVEIVRTIINLAHSMDLDVVAEGVETSTQVELLRSLGSEYVQGYFCYRPLSAQQVEALFLAHPGIFSAPPELAEAA